MARISEETKRQIIDDFCNDYTYSALVEKYKVARSSIQRIVSPKYRERVNTYSRLYQRRKAEARRGLLGQQ